SLRPENKDSHKQVGYTYAVLLSVTQKVVDLFEVSIYVRYQGGDNSGTPDLSIAKGMTGEGEPLLGDLCTLLGWHIQDPVSYWERRRNNRVYELQHNRNPFIDNPQWATDIYSASCN
ncbi:endonuclease, partial [Shewanella profunda]|uniref:endonuclease n=1 Tax=Shewanella profunda TaxID=254793 RepID=UPI00200C88D3